MTTFLSSCPVYCLTVYPSGKGGLRSCSLCGCARTRRRCDKRSAALSPCFHLIYLSFFDRFPALFLNSDFSEETPGFSEDLGFFPKTWLWIQSVIFLSLLEKQGPGCSWKFQSGWTFGALDCVYYCACSNGTC